MNFIELFLLSAALSMDAFAVAICKGLSIPKATIRNSLIVGLYFGIFQALMPLIGYFTATLYADMIKNVDHWIAFVLLCFIGGKMVIGSFAKEDYSDKEYPEQIGSDIKSKRPVRKGKPNDSPYNSQSSLKPAQMLPLAIATSIDALAVGITFAIIHQQNHQFDIILAVSLIGIITLILSMAGVKIGNIFGLKFKSKAEFAGGMVLALIGLKILLEHLDIINI